MVALPPVNLMAVIGVAVLHFVIGMLWYSPLLFGKTWLNALGKTKKQMKKPGPALLLHLAAGFIFTYVLANAVMLSQAKTAIDGAMMGFFLWLGFVVTTNLATYIFENRKMKLYYIYMSYQFVGMLVSGAILALWV